MEEVGDLTCEQLDHFLFAQIIILANIFICQCVC